MSLFHRHKWVSQSAQRMVLQNYYTRGPKSGKEFGEGEPITEVLQRCETCSNLRTITLSGEWSIEDVRG